MQAAVKRLPADLRSIGQEAAADFADKFDELTQSVDDKGTELVDTLATKYTEALKSVDEEIAAEKEKNKGWVDKAKDAIRDDDQDHHGAEELLLGVLRKAAQAVDGDPRRPDRVPAQPGRRRRRRAEAVHEEHRQAPASRA